MFILSNYMHFVRNHNYLRCYPFGEQYSVDDSSTGEWRCENDSAASDNNLKFAWKYWDKTGKQLY